MVHPQKRIFIKRVLESTICRVCEIKKDMVLFNPRPASLYVHLDQILFDLKYDPSIIEIPVPRYFKEDDRIQVDLEFKEKVDKGAKKKKKKKKKKAKKKKDDDGDKKKKEPPRPFDQKLQLMDGYMNQFGQSTEPKQEIVKDPFTIELCLSDAIRLIQKNDRGRQGMSRVQLMVSKHLDNKKKNERAYQASKGNQRENDAALFIQKRIKGILARKQIESMREEEMYFLGMARRPKTVQEKMRDPI